MNKDNETRKGLYSLASSFRLGFDFICVVFAIIYTCKQFAFYLDNNDFSKIAFEKFTESSTDSYPTYTICLEDSRLAQIYKKEMVVTHNYYDHCNISPTCASGCFVVLKNSKLVLINQTIPVSCEGSHHTTPPPDYTSVDNDMLPPPDVRRKRSPGYKRDTNIEYDLASFGLEMMIIKEKNKTHIIGPEQYQLLLMGYANSFTYVVQPPNLTNKFDTFKLEMAFKIRDIMDLNFDEAVIDMYNVVADFTIETENGSTYGWHTNDYKKISTYCLGEDHFVDFGSSSCEIPKSLRLSFEKKINVKYPIEKVYQDPNKICYSTNVDQSIDRKKEQITFDLRKMIYDVEGDFAGFGESHVHPAMTIYIHRQGQFIRGMDMPIASFTGKVLASYCLEYPYKSDFNDHPEKFHDIKNTCAGTKISFDISLVTILRSRHDGQKPCNEGLKDEDSKIISMIMHEKQLGCVPTYWQFLNISSQDLQECDENWQYRVISNITSNFTYYGEKGMIGSIRGMFYPPCEEMIIIVNKRKEKGRDFQWSDFNNDKIMEVNETGLYLDIIINNDNPRFQIIENNRSFTVESCWAGIGGFVGIFIGVSVRQVPELAKSLLDWILNVMPFKIRIHP